MRLLHKLAYAVLAVAPLPSVAQALNENFNSLTLAEQVTNSDILSCSGSEPSNNLTMSIEAGSNPWGILVSDQYTKTWSGSGPTQSWAINSGVMAIHAEAQSNDSGYALISRATFDRTKYLSAVAKLKMTACTNDDDCMMGVTLINSESDYREISFRLVDNYAVIWRYAPCEDGPMRDGNGDILAFPLGTEKTLRVEYRGPESSWRYYVDGALAYYNRGGGLRSEETTSDLGDAALLGDPRIGLYFTAEPNGEYVEGLVDRASVYSLAKVTGATATASSSYGGFPVSNAVDGDVSTRWNSGAIAPGWIELDLGSAKTIHKLRLRVSQFPSGATTHNVYAGATSNPATLVGSISKTTSDGEWLEIDTLEAGVTGRYVRVSTTSSPSWVSWMEIEVYE